MQRLWRTLEMAAWAAFFALAAAVLVLRYAVLPHIERLRPEIVERVSAIVGEPGLSDWLSAQRDIEVRNAEIEWRDEQRAAPPLVLSALNLRLNNDGEHHRLGFAARLPENLGTSVEVRAELAAGDIDDLRGW